MDNFNRILEIESRIKELEREKQELIEELELIKQANPGDSRKIIGSRVSDNPPATVDEKITLFAELLRCRKDVFPKLWKNTQKGTKGYSPVCKNEWIKGLCEKPKTKCSECPNRAFLQLDEKIIRSHLEGKITIGTYTIREDDTCIFLAADFDKTTWQADVEAYKKVGIDMGIEIYIERSRSGNGAHAWLFFSEPIKARLARQVGSIIIAKASMQRHNLSLESYDRFFPSQDTLPKGGFGNLIALPLQKIPRQNGNSIFIDDLFQPYENQWEFLSKCRRLSLNDVNYILREFFFEFCNSSPIKNDDVLIAEQTINVKRKDIEGCYDGIVKIEIGATLSIDIENLPSKLITSLKKSATFANPKFFELQKLRFSTWRTPRYIFCGEIQANYLVLPRGTVEECMEIIKDAGAKAEIKDSRLKPGKVNIHFSGELNLRQTIAVTAMVNHENGVLVAPTGSGKTVMACKIIAERKVPALILVHRKQLIEQWKNHLKKFLNMDEEDIGVFGSNKKSLKGKIDISMLQTLSKKKDFDEIASNYGHIIMDECHHIPAFSFESVLKKFPAIYFLGLTATPYRKDGHQPIIYMQCGPIRYELSDKNVNKTDRRVIIRETSFLMPQEYGDQPQIHEIWDHLIIDRDRLNLVANDVIESLKQDRFPLILSDRKDHLFLLYDTIKRLTGDFGINGLIFIGTMSEKSRKKAFEKIQESLNHKKPVFILSTGSLIGEGFDLPELDTLMLAMPISFKGRLVQYAGRLHQNSSNKEDIIIYDYLDTHIGLTISMFKKRVPAYKKMGYEIQSTDNPKINKWAGKR
jgi:superfamily II DNA or RNA helicase